MNQKMKAWMKDPKIVTIVALFSTLGATNYDTVSNVSENLYQAAQASESGKLPEIKLEGPEKKSEGDLIEFNAIESYGDHFNWLIEPRPAAEESIKTTDENRRCFIASKPGVYTITLIVSNCEGQAIEQRILTVESNHDCPDSEEPDDPIKPDPTKPPAGILGLTIAAFDLALSKVDSTSRNKADSVASVYETLSKDKSITNPQAFINQTLVELRNALGSDIESWKPWHAGINSKIASLISQGKLVSITEYRQAWSEIAEGLKSL